MTNRIANHPTPSAGIGELLRHWRGLRGTSQLELSHDTGVSQRHISFIESGRSTPSRQTLMDLAQALDIPLRDRNILLLVAGFAPLYPEVPWNATEMQGVTRATARMLRQHEPYPAIVMDRYWNVLQTNEAAPRFFNCFIDMAKRPHPRNMLHLMFDPEGMRPFMADWEEIAQVLVNRVYREAVGRVTDQKTQELVTALLDYPGVKPEWRFPKAPTIASTLPVIPIGFFHQSTKLEYFSMITTVGTPQFVAAQELRIESMFPANEATEQYHEKLLHGKSISSSFDEGGAHLAEIPTT